MKDKRLYILLTILIIAIIGLSLMDPIPQDQAYHDFADKRKILGIPNFWDVMSNLPMLFLGSYGIWFTLRNWSKRPELVANLIPLFLSFGILLACFGSAYYHWAPDNHTLVWDRLPMTLMFMPILSLLIYDFVGKEEGKWTFWIAVPLGIFSVFYWDYTESIGQGDLRFYAFVQFFPMLIAPFIVWIYYKKVSYLKYIFFILGWYIVAKLCEYYDKEIYEFLGFWSGHTIKHLTSSISLVYILMLMNDWEKDLIRN